MSVTVEAATYAKNDWPFMDDFFINDLTNFDIFNVVSDTQFLTYLAVYG